MQTSIMHGLIIDTLPLTVYEHMAVDELLSLNTETEFTLRFYNWKEKAVSFGYGQNCDFVIKNLPPEFKDCSITRRPTGGGVVFHSSDITFSCIMPLTASYKPLEIYSKLHRVIFTALKERDINCRLSSDKTTVSRYQPNTGRQAGKCFVNPVEHDALDEKGIKILGGALRKFDKNILYQGSLLFEGARQRQPEIELSIIKSFSKLWNIKWKRQKLDAITAGNTEKLTSDTQLNTLLQELQEKYFAQNWVCKL